MKKFLLFVGLAIFTEQLHAQDTSLWVGVSKNSDPLIRRQEAFMDALCRYITCSAVHVGKSTEKDREVITTVNSIKTCRFQILSDIMDEEEETVTISIGRGTLINYKFISSSLKTDIETQTDIVLIVTYEEDSERNKTRSQHEYRNHCIEREDASGHILKSSNEFKYECVNVGTYE